MTNLSGLRKAAKAALKTNVWMFIVPEKRKCGYCRKVVNVAGQVGTAGTLSDRWNKREWLTEPTCLQCLNAFLPKRVRLVTLRE